MTPLIFEGSSGRIAQTSARCLSSFNVPPVCATVYTWANCGATSPSKTFEHGSISAKIEWSRSRLDFAPHRCSSASAAVLSNAFHRSTPHFVPQSILRLLSIYTQTGKLMMYASEISSSLLENTSGPISITFVHKRSISKRLCTSFLILCIIERLT